MLQPYALRPGTPVPMRGPVRQCRNLSQINCSATHEGFPRFSYPEPLRMCRWPEIDRTNSGIMTHREREIQFLRRCMPGFPDMVRVWKLARCTAVS